MKRRHTCIALLLLIVTVSAGCTTTQLTSITATTYKLPRETELPDTPEGQPPDQIATLADVWISAYSVVHLQPNISGKLTSADVTEAILEIPVVPKRQYIPDRNGFSPTNIGPDVTIAAYQVLHPSWSDGVADWLGSGTAPSDANVVRSVPSDTVQLAGPGLPYAYSYLQLDITDIVQAWLAGEPNYGLLLVSLAEDKPDVSNGWRYTTETPQQVRTLYGGFAFQTPEVQQSEIVEAEMRILITRNE